MNRCIVCGRYTKNPKYHTGTRVKGIIVPTAAVCNLHKQAEIGSGFCTASSTNGFCCTLIHNHKGPHVAHDKPLQVCEVWSQ